jgi:dihydroorotase
VKAYRQDIAHAIGKHQFQPFMTTFFRPYSESELKELKDHIIGIKLYPQGATTNSEKGIADLADGHETLQMMESMGIPLFVHGESTSAFVMDREAAFYDEYRRLASTYPKLKIVMEHITTAGSVDLLNEYENLYATVTLHHLIITLDDVAGGMLTPHLFCKPIAKRPEDRDRLLQAALEAHPKLSFGSDSAPHPTHKKECCGCAAGVFTAPMALACLADLFDQHDCLGNLQAFVSDRAHQIYGVEVPKKKVTLKRETFSVPEKYENVTPYLAGEDLAWRVTEIESSSP